VSRPNRDPSPSLAGPLAGRVRRTPKTDTLSRNRKATGAYYTPAPLVNLLLDHALPKAPPAPIKILDPACGAGDFLRAAHARLGDAAQLFGIDIDPAALAACKSVLPPTAHLAHANALLKPPEFCRDGAFDLVLGNPPFVNAIEGNLTTKDELRRRFPSVRGAADLAHYFLDQAIRLVRPGGRVAFVLPRGLLNSPAAQRIRATLPPHLHPNLIYAPERHDFFPGAAVFVCLLILGPDQICQVSTDNDPATARFAHRPIAGDNWWLALQSDARPSPVGQTFLSAQDQPSSPRLSDRFEVTASMTAADAYDIAPHLIDDEHVPGLKLATTGLIEPGQCLWGQKPCRYLKRDYAHPRLPAAESLTRSLTARVVRAARPKILVAGLARRIEAFFDPAGEYIGAVSTFTIHHPADDLATLQSLLAHLHTDDVTAHLIAHLGANGMRGRHITLKKSFLQDLPIPNSWP